jgi:N-carbamoyl-L-amino-acid hydrolase
MGRHLDTQPTGGRFDGVLGVLGALEVMRTLHESACKTNAAIEIVNWTNEEGSRFAPAMLASGVFAGVFTVDYANGRQDRDGRRFGDERSLVTAVPRRQARKLGAMFELHIEQGPVLEDEGNAIE